MTDHIKHDVCPLCSGSGSITYGAAYDRDCAALATDSAKPAGEANTDLVEQLRYRYALSEEDGGYDFSMHPLIGKAVAALATDSAKPANCDYPACAVHHPCTKQCPRDSAKPAGEHAEQFEALDLENHRLREQIKTQPTVDEPFALLPGVYYMDPPDGGSPTLLEQLTRMAEDSAKWRALAAETQAMTEAVKDWTHQHDGLIAAPTPDSHGAPIAPVIRIAIEEEERDGAQAAALVVAWLRANTNELGAAERIEARFTPPSPASGGIAA